MPLPTAPDQAGVLGTPSIFSSTAWRVSHLSPDGELLLRLWVRRQVQGHVVSSDPYLKVTWPILEGQMYDTFYSLRIADGPFKRIERDWPYRWEKCQGITEVFLKHFFCLIFSFLAGSFERASPCSSKHRDSHSTTRASVSAVQRMLNGSREKDLFLYVCLFCLRHFKAKYNCFVLHPALACAFNRRDLIHCWEIVSQLLVIWRCGKSEPLRKSRSDRTASFASPHQFTTVTHEHVALTC